MDSRATYLVSLLEKLGAPLLSAVNEAELRQQMQGGEDVKSAGSQAAAEHMAELLGKSTQLSLNLSKIINVTEDGSDNADSTRVALAALSGPIIANLFRISGRIPADHDIDKLGAALQAVLTYGDNFTANQDSAARLQMLDQEMVPADENQTYLQYLQVMVPVLNAVIAFPFGQNEKTLITEVAQKLIDYAESMRARVFSDLRGMPAERANLALLRAAANIYSQCHFAEMTRLMSMEESARNQDDVLNMAGVWEAFDKRMAMLEAIAVEIVPGAQDDSGSRAEPTAAGAPSDRGETGHAPDQKTVPEPESDSGQDGQNQDDQTQAGDEGFNPMAFFSAGDNQDTNTGSSS